MLWRCIRQAVRGPLNIAWAVSDVIYIGGGGVRWGKLVTSLQVGSYVITGEIIYEYLVLSSRFCSVWTTPPSVPYDVTTLATMTSLTPLL